MARYIDMDLLKEMIEAKADTVINAKQQFHYIAGWLDHLPPADVAPIVEGEWIENRGVCSQPYCSVCGAIGNKGNYCSHCGAKMKGE